MGIPMTDRIDIALGFDAKYAPHAAATIASVARHAPGARLRITILYVDVDAQTKARFEASAPGAEYNWVEVRDEDLPPMEQRGYFTRANLFRLGVERLAPTECERIIYLDADVIACRDIRDFWSIDLMGAPLGGVEDTFTKADEFAAKHGLPAPREGYFNAGILLIDLKKVREERLFERGIEMLRANMDAFPFLDQDVLNILCWERWRRVSPCWNVQRRMTMAKWEVDIPASQRLNGDAPGLIHYTDWEKPWVKNGYNPWAGAYWENLERTPFLAQVAAAEGFDTWTRFRLKLRWLRHRYLPARAA
jgi:lipopolysaccharide biosynthesis glycosyltransferase